MRQTTPGLRMCGAFLAIGIAAGLIVAVPPPAEAQSRLKELIDRDRKSVV